MHRRLLILIAVLVVFSVSDAVADVDFGVNVDWSKTEGANSGDWGVGARLDFGTGLRGMIAFDYFFTNADDFFDEDDLTSEDFDLKFWELNGNIIYQFPGEVVHPYIGGGVGIARRTFNNVEDLFDDERTELGFNVLGGMKFGSGVVEPFIEVRGTFYGDDEGDDLPEIGDLVRFGDRFVVSGGIVF